jgi:hypothetical protein
MWHRVTPRLAEHYTVVATDLRGYGGSVPVGHFIAEESPEETTCQLLNFLQ